MSTTEAKVQRLATSYPELPKQILTGILAAVGGDVARADALIRDMMSGKKESSPAPSKKSSSSSSFSITPAAAAALNAAYASSPSSAPSSSSSSSSAVPSLRSQAQLYGSSPGSCGYCKGAGKGSVTFGMVCSTLRAEEYQALIDVGWRRSGDYLYKQANAASCCPHYTIRLNVERFQPDKAQKKAMKRWERFLQTGEQSGAQKEEDGEEDDHESHSKKPVVATVDPHLVSLRSQLLQTIESLVSRGELPSSLSKDTYEKALRVYEFVQIDANKGSKKKKKITNEATAATNAMTDNNTPAATAEKNHPPFHYSSNAALVIGGFLKKEKNNLSALDVAQLIASALSSSSSSASSASSHAFVPFVSAPLGYLNFHLPGYTPPAPPSVSAVADSSSSSSAAAAAAKKKQPFEKHMSDNKGEANKPEASKPVHTFEIKQVPAEFNAEAFQVYKKYQMAVHHDKESKLTPDSYTNFLCSPPFPSSPDSPYNGFHHHYLLDGKIIAVGVVDVLPNCLSSVYLYYDPALEHLNLGTVTAMKEIEWTQRLHRQYPSLRYYYLGYYVHSCQKMRYKSRYAPAELLCPVRLTWHPLSLCVPALDSMQRQVESSLATQRATGGIGGGVSSSRCVILSDVAPEVLEADGTPLTYLSPSIVQHVNPSAAQTSAAKKKKKKKKKNKKTTTTTETTDAAKEAEQESEGEEEEGEEQGEKNKPTTPTPAASAAASSAASSTAAAAAAAAASASSSSARPTPSSSPSPSPFPLIDSTHPYTFSSSTKQQCDSHRLLVAQSVESVIPVQIYDDIMLTKEVDKKLLKQIKTSIYEYAALVGEEVAKKIVVVFQ